MSRFFCETWEPPQALPLPPRTNHAPLRHLRAPAPHRDISLAPRPRRASQQTPGLPVNLKIALRLRTIIKVHRHPRHKRIRRHHIPQIPRDHIRRQKINILQRINLPTPRRPHTAPRIAMTGGTLHLHPPKPPPALHRKIIRTAISPRLQHRETKHSSLSQKRRLHRLPQPLSLRRFQHPPRSRPPLPARIRFFTHKKSAAKAAQISFCSAVRHVLLMKPGRASLERRVKVRIRARLQSRRYRHLNKPGFSSTKHKRRKPKSPRRNLNPILLLYQSAYHQRDTLAQTIFPVQSTT